jgi:hypothetical protein
LIAVFVAAFVLMAKPLYDFLAVSRPLGQDILVVETGIPEEALAQVPGVLRSGHYHWLVVVGPADEASDRNSPADAAGSELEKLGCDVKAMVKINVTFQSTRHSYVIPVGVPPSCGVALRFQLTRRTYANALAVSEWLQSSRIPAQGVDVFTVSVHARKSWILFQHAIGDKCRVGIIAASQTLFNPRSWLLSREGIYLVPRNLIGYFYAKCLISLGG